MGLKPPLSKAEKKKIREERLKKQLEEKEKAWTADMR